MEASGGPCGRDLVACLLCRDVLQACAGRDLKSGSLAARLMGVTSVVESRSCILATVLEWGVGEVGERKGRGQGGVLQTEKSETESSFERMASSFEPPLPSGPLNLTEWGCYVLARTVRIPSNITIKWRRPPSGGAEPRKGRRLSERWTGLWISTPQASGGPGAPAVSTNPQASLYNPLGVCTVAWLWA